MLNSIEDHEAALMERFGVTTYGGEILVYHRANNPHGDPYDVVIAEGVTFSAHPEDPRYKLGGHSTLSGAVVMDGDVLKVEEPSRLLRVAVALHLENSALQRDAMTMKADAGRQLASIHRAARRNPVV